MQVRYGAIRKYSERGFGFLKPVIFRPEDTYDREVWFHITAIKAADPELARQLDDGHSDGVSLWFTTERSGGRTRVKSIWSNTDQLPAADRTALEDEIIRIWRDLNGEAADDLLTVTTALLGRDRCSDLACEAAARQQAEREAAAARARMQEAARLEAERQRLAAEQVAARRRQQERAEEIRRVCEEHQIAGLYHFTRLANIAVIMQLGLRGRAALSQINWTTPPTYNDSMRLDGHPNAICLSIGFPNYRMFYKYAGRNKCDWVVIELGPSVLWELDCAFCRTNAASNDVRRIPLQQRQTPDALRGLFYPRVNRGLIPASYTTDPQAEVLVFDAIDPARLVKVHFCTAAALAEGTEMLDSDAAGRCVVTPNLFAPRQDWDHWRTVSPYYYDDPY